MIRKRFAKHSANRQRQLGKRLVRSFELLESRMLLTTVFSDDFESGAISSNKWALREAIVLPSDAGPIGNYSAALCGCDKWESYTQLSSTAINVSSYGLVELDFSLRTGIGQTYSIPDSSQDLYVEYYSSSGAWVLASGGKIDQSTVSSTSFTPKRLTLPSSALHSNFAFRFRHPNAGQAIDGYWATWQIDDVSAEAFLPPTVSLGGASGTQPDNQGYSLTWNTNGDSVSARLYLDGTLLDSSTVKNGSFSITPSMGLGAYDLRVTATNSNGLSTSSTRSFTMEDDDNQGPTIALGGSNGEESPLATQAFSWSVSDDSGVSSNLVSITGPGGLDFTTEDTQGTFNFDDFGGPGVFQISVTATDNDTDRGAADRATRTSTRSAEVTNEPPVAHAAANRSQADEGTIITFDGSASSDANGLDDIQSYEWNFGDDKPATGVTVDHAYADEGTYPVVLTVTDRQGESRSDTLTVMVTNVAPTIVNLPFATGPVGEAVTLTASIYEPGTADSVTYTWDFGDDTTLIGTDLTAVNKTYATEGDYNVRLTVTDDDGASSTQATHAVIGPPVTFTTAAQTVAEDSGSLLVEAQLQAPLNVEVSVPLLLSGTASEAADYDLTNATLVFPAGSTSATATIDVLEDVLSEDSETIVLTMGLPTGASHGAIAQHTILITDNDPLPSVWFSSDGRTVREERGTIEIKADLSAPAGRDVVVPLNINGTAESPSDYTLANDARVVIPAGQLSGFARVLVVDDDLGETNESINFTMQPSNQALLSNAPDKPLTYTLIIAQSDAPSISFASSGAR